MATVRRPEADSEPRSETWSEPGEDRVDVRIPELPSLDERRFQIDGERARGGVGLVLEARDRLLGRRVALKQPFRSDRSRGVARFLREALITARLQHPAIVPIYDAGLLADGEPCYTMRLVPGATLRDAVLAARGLDERLALLPHVQAVADAVAYAHGEGILHRDLKPANVLVGPFGETVVIDWGLAKELRGDSAEVDAGTLARDVGVLDENLTHIGSVVGTPAYMPPEQARGEEVDERADVYAIGAMLYHLLTGEAPYPHDGVASVLIGPPLAVEAREPGAPRDLSAIVAKAMAREASARYPNAGELAHDLKRFATGQLVGARRYSNWALARRFVARNRATVLVGAALVVALVAGVAGIVYERNQTAVENNRLRLMQAQAVLDRDPTAAASWLKTYRVEPGRESTAIEVAARAQASGVARHVLSIPNEAPVRLCLAESGRQIGVLGREGSIWLFDLDRQTRRQLGTLSGPPDACLIVDEGRRLVAWALRGGKTMVARLPDGEAVPVSMPAPARGIDPLRWVGSRLLVTDEVTGQVHLVSLDGESARRLENIPPAIRQAIPTPDGTTIYASDRQGGLWRVPIAGGAATLLEKLEPPIFRMDMSPDGRELVLSARERVNIRDLATGDSWWHTSSGNAGQPIPVWWARGGALFIAGDHRRDPEVKWWDRRRGDPVTVGTKAYFREGRVTRDGDRAAWTDNAGTIRVADLSSLGVRTLAGHHTTARGFDMSPDGSWLAVTYGKSVRVFTVPRDKARRIDLGAQPVIPIVTEGGQIVAVRGGRKVVGIDPRTGQERPLLELDQDGKSLALSPSRKRVALDGLRGRVAVLDLESSRLTELPPQGDGPGGSLAFVDEDTLVSQDSFGDVNLWEVASGTHRVLARLARSMIMEIAVARSRPRFAIGSVYEILVVDTEPLRLRRFDAGGSVVFRVALSADGSKLLAGFGDGRVKLWDLDKPGMPSRELARRSGFVSALLLTPDERAVFVADETGSLYRADLATGTGSEIGRHPARIVDGRLSPSARWLATSDTTGEIRLWDVASSGLAVLRGQEESQNIRFIDDSHLLSVGPDGRMKLTALEAEAFVPAGPAHLAHWLDTLTSARTDPTGDPLSMSAGP